MQCTEQKQAWNQFHAAFHNATEEQSFWEGIPTRFSFRGDNNRFVVMQKLYLAAYCSWCWLWGATSLLLKWQIKAITVAGSSLHYVYRAITPNALQRLTNLVTRIFGAVSYWAATKLGITTTLELMQTANGDRLCGEVAATPTLSEHSSQPVTDIGQILCKLLLKSKSYVQRANGSGMLNRNLLMQDLIDSCGLASEEKPIYIYNEVNSGFNKPRALPGRIIILPKDPGGNLGCFITDLPRILGTNDHKSCHDRVDVATKAMFAREVAAGLVGYYTRNYLSRVLVFLTLWAMVAVAGLKRHLTDTKIEPLIGLICLQLHRLALWLKGHESEHLADCLALWLTKDRPLQAHLDMRKVLDTHEHPKGCLTSLHATLGTRPALAPRQAFLECFHAQLAQH